MDIQQKYKKLKVKFFFLTLIVIALVGYIAYDKVLYKYIPTKTENKVDKEVDLSVNIELDEIIALVKNYYYEKDFIKEDNLVSWLITSSEYMGYYADDKNTKYYQVQGAYSCRDFSSSCVYTSVEDSNSKKEKNYFEIYAAIEETDGEKKIKTIEKKLETEDDFIQVNKSVPDNTKNKENIKKIFRNYYETNQLVNNDNLNTWDIKNVQYIKAKDENSLYQLTGTYSCKDNSSECLRLAVENEANENNVYSFDLIVEIKERKDVYTIINIEHNISFDKSVTTTKEDLVNLLKDYTKNNSLMIEDKLLKWDIATVTYRGYYKESPNKKYYMLTGIYSCNDNSGTCLKLDTTGVKRSDGSYPYSIYMEVTYTTNTAKVTSLTETIPSTNDFISSNETIN